MTAVPYVPNPSLDLVMERIVDVPPDLVWLAWTSPEHLTQWFCPRPWMTPACDIDLRLGGKFRTVMRGPEGQAQDNTGCDLEVIAPSRLVWTGALEPGFRPASTPDTSGVDALHGHHHHRTARHGHEVHGHGHAQGPGGLPGPRKDGLPRRLGRGLRAARGDGAGAAAHALRRSAGGEGALA